jgi:hypothetical protein
MANETLRFYAAGPYDHLNWAAFDDFLRVGLTDEEYSIDRFSIISRQPRVTNFSLTGKAENHIQRPSYFEVELSFKVFDYDNLILLKDWYEASRAGSADVLRDVMTIEYPTNANQAGMVFIRWVNDDQPQVGTTSPVFEGSAGISVDYGTELDDTIPWVMVDADHTKMPRRHYFIIKDQQVLFNRVELNVSPSTTLDFSAGSLVYPFMQTEACIVTNAKFREELDDDMQYWRVECSMRTVYSTFRYAEIT